jgi:hypothetical protein
METTLFQLEASAKAPCTSTMVGLAAGAGDAGAADARSPASAALAKVRTNDFRKYFMGFPNKPTMFHIFGKIFYERAGFC